VPQRNYLYGYLKQANVILFLFFLYKIREQDGEQVLPGGGELLSVRRGKKWGNGEEG
jgi:hypothetical protein